MPLKTSSPGLTVTGVPLDVEGSVQAADAASAASISTAGRYPMRPGGSRIAFVMEVSNDTPGATSSQEND